MSNAHPKAKHSPPRPTNPTPHDLAALAAMLHDAAQALLSLSESSPPVESTPPEEADDPTLQQDEYRSYRVPFHILDDEQELLAEYGTDRIAHVFREIYTELYLMLELMKGYAERNDDEDFTYFLIAQKLFKPLDRLSKACSIIVDFELQSKEPSLEA